MSETASQMMQRLALELMNGQQPTLSPVLSIGALARLKKASSTPFFGVDRSAVPPMLAPNKVDATKLGAQNGERVRDYRGVRCMFEHEGEAWSAALRAKVAESDRKRHESAPSVGWDPEP